LKWRKNKLRAGFRPHRLTHDHLCSLRILTEKARAHRQPLYMCFVDFKKAFDKVNHLLADDGGRWTWVSQDILSLLFDRCTKIKDPIQGDTSGWFQAKQGVRQPLQPNGGTINEVYTRWKDLIMVSRLEECKLRTFAARMTRTNSELRRGGTGAG